MNPLRAVLLFCAIALATSCDRHDDNDMGDPPSSLPGGPESYAPKGSTPPVVLTLNVAFAENVPLSDMEKFADKLEAANESLWQVTEGQIRIGRLRIRDNAHPGSKSADYNNLNLSGNDIVVWSPANFNGPGIAYVLVGAGRFGRFMGVPDNILNTTFLHEFGHMIFQLTWTAGPVLIDEYDEEPDDSACLMELEYFPLRWCAQDNHLTQPGQPHSCWTQIQADYPDFTFTNTHTAAQPLAPPVLEFTDTPSIP